MVYELHDCMIHCVLSGALSDYSSSNRTCRVINEVVLLAGGKIFALLPDYVLPYAIHLLAHDPDLTGTDDVTSLSNIRE